MVHPADQDDTKTLASTLLDAQAKLGAFKEADTSKSAGSFDLVADKGNHSRDVFRDVLKHLPDTCRSRISEPGHKGRLRLHGDTAGRDAVYGNRNRISSSTGKALLLARGERVECSFARSLDRGGMRRVHLRGLANVEKRYII